MNSSINTRRYPQLVLTKMYRSFCSLAGCKIYPNKINGQGNLTDKTLPSHMACGDFGTGRLEKTSSSYADLFNHTINNRRVIFCSERVTFQLFHPGISQHVKYFLLGIRTAAIVGQQHIQ